MRFRISRELLHKLLVDVEPAARVDDQGVASVPLGLVERPLGDVDRVAPGALLVDVRARLAADLDELVHRRRAVDVAGRQRDVHAVLLAQVTGELGAGGRLSGALEAGHQDHGRPRLGERELASRPPITSASSSQTIFTTCWPGFRESSTSCPSARSRTVLGELLDDLEVDVRLEQSQAHLAHRLGDVVLGQLAARADIVEGCLEPVGKCVEHELLRLAPQRKLSLRGGEPSEGQASRGRARRRRRSPRGAGRVRRGEPPHPAPHCRGGAGGSRSSGSGITEPSRPSACVNSLGMIHILFDAPWAICGRVWRYW